MVYGSEIKGCSSDPTTLCDYSGGPTQARVLGTREGNSMREVDASTQVQMSAVTDQRGRDMALAIWLLLIVVTSTTNRSILQ